MLDPTPESICMRAVPRSQLAPLSCGGTRPTMDFHARLVERWPEMAMPALRLPPSPASSPDELKGKLQEPCSAPLERPHAPVLIANTLVLPQRVQLSSSPTTLRPAPATRGTLGATLSFAHRAASIRQTTLLTATWRKASSLHLPAAEGVDVAPGGGECSLTTVASSMRERWRSPASSAADPSRLRRSRLPSIRSNA